MSARLSAVRGGKTGGDEYRILNMPRVSVYNVDGLAAWANATAKAVTWDTIEYDTDSMFDLANHATRIRANTPGVYEVKGWMMWASNATAYRQIYLSKTSPSGTTTYADNVVQAVNGTVTSQEATAHIPLNKDDYVELVGVQGSGGNLAFVVASDATRDNGFQACLISTLG